MSIQAIQNFRSQSVWALIGLSIITIGFYWLFWLLRNTRTVNCFFPGERISNVFTVLFVIANILIVSMIAAYNSEYSSMTYDLRRWLSFLNYALLLIWIFRIRTRFHKILDFSSFNPYRVKILWMVLFGIYYFQFKINRIRSLEKQLVT